MRVDKLELSPTRPQLHDDSGPMFQNEYEKQNKINKYLTGTLKHLNMTIDILIDQYDPVKLKMLKLQNAKIAQESELDYQQQKES